MCRSAWKVNPRSASPAPGLAGARSRRPGGRRRLRHPGLCCPRRRRGGVPPPEGFDQASRDRHRAEVSDNYNKAQLANKALEYLRLKEALGRPPTLKEFSRGGFEHRAAEAGLGAEPEVAWTRYERIICDALAETRSVFPDDIEQARGAGLTQHGKEPYETNEFPAGQPTYHKSEADDLRQGSDTSTQRQPESTQEMSW